MYTLKHPVTSRRQGFGNFLAMQLRKVITGKYCQMMHIEREMSNPEFLLV